MKKICLFFGSFDPIHIGHMIISEYITKTIPIDELWFIISPSSNSKKLTEKNIRKKMIDLVFQDDIKLKSCNIEFNMSYPYYSYNTINLLKKIYPTYSFVLLLGMDNIIKIRQWKDYKLILKNNIIYVYPRYDFLNKKIYKHKNIILLKKAPIINISSTIIRNSFTANNPYKYMISEKIYNFILKEKLYTK